MNQSVLTKDQLYQVILAPVVTEKSTIIADQDGQVVFYVQPSANRHDIKAAIELAFDVEVDSVKVLNVKGKTKRVGRVMGKRSNRKKAYIRLKEGSEIDFSQYQA